MLGFKSNKRKYMNQEFQTPPERWNRDSEYFLKEKMNDREKAGDFWIDEEDTSPNDRDDDNQSMDSDEEIAQEDWLAINLMGEPLEPHHYHSAREQLAEEAISADGKARQRGGIKTRRRLSFLKYSSKEWIPGLAVTVFLLTDFVVFWIMLQQTRLFPPRLLLMVVGVSFVLAMLCWTLMAHSSKVIRFSFGLGLAAVSIIAVFIGMMYVHRTKTAISGITGETVETTRVGVYILNQEKARSIKELEGCRYGILADLDREKTDIALTMMEEELGDVVSTREYDGLAELADSLLKKEVEAIILNSAYLGVIHEMAGYESFAEEIRQVGFFDVVSRIDTDPEETVDLAYEMEDETEEKAEILNDTSSSGRHVYTIYLSGIDTRDEMTASSRSDVNIIATINLDTRQVLLVSTPRDFFVPLSISSGVPDKLTHAGIYGIDVCMNTLAMLYDIEVKYYFRVNFFGFVEIIDALGGIAVHSDYEFDSKNVEGYHYIEGENYMNGEAALVFARERYSFESGDRQRGRNQMAVIEGVIRKMMSSELLKNYSSILAGLVGCFVTNISYEDIARVLMTQLSGGQPWNVVTYSVDGTGDTQKPYSMSQPAYVMIPDYSTVEKAKLLMAKVRNGQQISQGEADSYMTILVDSDEPDAEPVVSTAQPGDAFGN